MVVCRTYLRTLLKYTQTSTIVEEELLKYNMIMHRTYSAQ
ncbi:unnamed protein product [Heterotrigona itama]|uniref:Uncharacterized protein n=1 Tax=Heterotrigona itama TaxID=395501 RepID=A0A6V7HB57_9HYME|nr:unnamed protein product [Heterotrigona itama]